MKRLLPLLLLLPAALSAAEQSYAERLSRELATFAGEAAKLEKDLAPEGSLPEAPFDPQSPMPEPPPGQSAAAADGGLLFDNNQSRLAYIGNVRLNDPHLQLRAAHRLYIVLPQQEKKEQAPEKKEPAATPAQKQANKPAEAPKPEPAAKPEPIPAYATVENAAVDAPGSRVLLQGRAASPSISIQRGEDSLTLQPCSGEPAQIFTNAEGDVLMLGADIVIIRHDENGGEWKLEAAAGPVYYRAAERKLIVPGRARITTPQGTMECTQEMHITMVAMENPPAKKDTPFSAFAAMQFREIEKAHARGDVVLTTPATAERPAAEARGDYLSFDATTGDCLLTEQCHIVYGGFSLDTRGKIELFGNGDALISASEDEGKISGTYERPAPVAGQAPLSGTWSTRGSISYSVETNCITFPHGLQTKDPVSSFSCTHTADAFLTAKPGATSERKSGMPNLTLAQQEGIARIRARGNVRLHSDAAGATPACDMSADVLDTHVATAKTSLQSTDGKRAHVRYGDYKLTTTAPTTGRAYINLLENGDILALGEKVEATLPNDKGEIYATCQKELHLQREPGLLTLGENARINAPDGIMTARGILNVELAPGDTPPRAPAAYPQLSYNYSGLRRATTEKGGTMRTTQVSMQCEGLISIELAAGKAPTDNPRDSIRAATARGRVLLAGKDATGRLVRASGDRLDFDPATRNFYLNGRMVTLADEFNTHTAAGARARITIDPHNNVRITGERQTTYANHIQEQVEKNKKK